MVRLPKIVNIFRRRKFPISFVYSDAYWLVDIGNHVFPTKKYRLIYEKLLFMGVKKQNFFSPEPALDEDILLVHTSKYIKKLRTGRLSRSEIMELELPYKPEIFDFAKLAVGGTILATRLAMESRLAVHIGGGFHHAFPDHGEGFCVLNDIAVSLAKAKQEGAIKRGMVVDCDVHQGNGTAAIFSDEESIFTFSLHQMDLYPAQKPASNLDVGMWSGDGDEKYIPLLKSRFPQLYREFEPDLILYLAGADPYEGDQLGGLRLTQEGLEERDRIIIGEALKLDIPIAVVLAGGYAADVGDTVSIHLNTIKTAQSLFRKYH
jgi:acetoin utilization deacetylase AcuC-like enzyme